ncbi:MAG: class II glutamine amidotransferase [Alphaproteobacteria bacterium]|nr:class II glutamine amidotransferase [Alphaproteobacteria bacterium]
MCRWIAYSGKPIFMDELMTKPSHSLVEQSFDTELNLKADGSIWATNGDGFGVGWYNPRLEEPGVFKGNRPAWNDENLHELCRSTESHIFFGHIRASTNGKVQRSNSHPFKYKNWLFQHNGDVLNFSEIKRELQFELDPELFKQIQGTTDSETCFYLALHYGITENSKQGLERMIQRVEKAQKDNGLELGVSFSVAVTDGKTLYTLRYASGLDSNKTQFYSTDTTCVEDMAGTCHKLPDGGVIVVSEPLDRSSDKWVEVPENGFTTIRAGNVKIDKLNI